MTASPGLQVGRTGALKGLELVGAVAVLPRRLAVLHGPE